MKRAPALAAAILAAAASPEPLSSGTGLRQALRDTIVSVGIARRASSVRLTPRGAFSVIEQGTGRITALEAGAAYTVEADAGRRLLIGKHFFSGPARVLPGKDGEHLELAGRRYRGNLVFRPNEDRTVTVIDELGVEDYLTGVLPKEMSPDWPLEALKAQAVVSRTFALRNLGKHADEGYDLSDDAFSQVYAGLEAASESVLQAVRQTRGEVLSWDGELLPAHFHSCCGGRTAAAAAVWGGSPPQAQPLRGVSDRWCRNSPHYEWTAYFRTDDILRALQSRGVDLLRLERIRLGEDDRSGRASTLSLKGDGGWREVSANSFRLWISPTELRSAFLRRVRKTSKGFEFTGRGYGHGVGLCQWGSRAQAESGRGYEQILDHYFPGAGIEKLGS